jgi:hypothetical protein
MTDEDRERFVRCKARAKQQIEMGEALHRRLRGYATRDDCVDAMHYLIPDGGAARQGNDPRWLLNRRSPGLDHLVPLAVKIEVDTVRSWDYFEAGDVYQRLVARGMYEAAERIHSHWFGR